MLLPGDRLLPDALPTPVERGTLFRGVTDVSEGPSDVEPGLDDKRVLEEVDGSVEDEIGDGGGVEAVTFRT